jgi:hypothetical protein
MRMRFKDALCVIPIGRILLVAAASGAVLATNAFAQSAREVRDASPTLNLLRLLTAGFGTAAKSVSKERALSG